MPKTDIRVSLPKYNLSFTTQGEVTEQEDGSLKVESLDGIHYHDQLVVFGSFRVELETEYNFRHYEGKQCLLTRVPIGHKWGYETDMALRIVNRRKSLRIPCGERAIFQKGHHHGTVETFVRDVSIDGVGLSVPSDCLGDLQVGCKCSISILITDYTIQIQGVVARIAPDNKAGYSLVGFRLTNTPDSYRRLVMSLQRKDLAKLTHKK